MKREKFYSEISFCLQFRKIFRLEFYSGRNLCHFRLVHYIVGDYISGFDFKDLKGRENCFQNDFLGVENLVTISI